MIDRDCSMVMSSFYYSGSMQAIGGIHGEKSASVGSDGTIEMIFSYLIYTLHRLASRV